MDDGVQAMTREEVVMWDIQTAHGMLPSYQDEMKGEAYYQIINSYHRHRNFDERRGFTVIFNDCLDRLAETNTEFDRPYVGQEAATTRANEIWRAFIAIDADYRFSPFKVTVISNRSLGAAIRCAANGQFALDESLAKAWHVLERPLVAIIEKLSVQLHFPLPVTRPQYPSTYQYQMAFDEFDHAFEAARRGRNAFRDLGAFLSFLISFWNKRYRVRPIQLLARWLSKALHLNFEWTADLLTFPPILSNATSHVDFLGMEMSPRSPWVKYVPMFVDFGIVVVAWVGNGPDITHEMIQSKITGPFLGGSIDVDAYRCDECHRRVRFNHQLLYHDPATFFKAREEAWMQSRENMGEPRTKRIVVKRLFGKVEVHVDELEARDLRWLGYACFEWVGEPGSYRRQTVASSNYELLFESYDARSRYWSGLHEEVNFCHLPAAPETVGEISISHATHDLPDNTQAIPLPSTSSCDPRPLPSLPAYVYNSDDEDEYDVQLDLPSPSTRPSTRPTPSTSDSQAAQWKIILRYRLGYNSDNFLSRPVLSEEGHPNFPNTDNGVDHALRTLGVVVARWKPSMSNADRVACLCACRALTDPSVRLSSIPEQFDIASRGLLNGLRHLQIEKVVHRYQEVDMHTKQSRDITEYRYAIGVPEKAMNKQWFVVVVDAPTLLEIARYGWTGILNITRNLAERGLPFATAKYYPASTKLIVPTFVKEGLGVIRHGEEYDNDSYLNYEARTASCLTGNRAAVALKEGGIIARLARELVNDIRKVSKPPGDLSWDNGELKGRGRVLGGVQTGEVLISDALDGREIEIILGRYVRFRNASKQDSATLWPSLSSWSKMWLNTGAWNDEAEAWFQEQVQGWRTPVAQRGERQKKNCVMRTSKEWKNAGRGLKVVRVVWDNYCRLAEEYVGCHFT